MSDTATPLRLVGTHEVRVMLGNLSRQRLFKITARPDFPEPVASLANGKVWHTHEVEAWIKNHRRQLAQWAVRPARKGSTQAPQL